MASLLERESHGYCAGQLLQWALRPAMRPVQQPDYRDLLQRYMDHAEFRLLVQEVAAGLGLVILDACEHGLIVGPLEDSVFHLKPGDFRPNSATVEDRLLDGLVQLGIAASIFPRASDLEEDSLIARPPITVDEVDELLRNLCEQLQQQTRRGVDPAAEEELSGLSEAWRLYLKRAEVNGSRNGRISGRTARGIIQFNLERLRELGCFTRHERAGRVEWQPTWRYQVQVRELAATAAFELVQSVLKETSCPA